MIDSKLAGQRIFDGVPGDVLKEISRNGRSLSLSEGRILMEEGDPVHSIYCILEGEVDILVPEDYQYRDDMNWVNLLVDGMCIGEYSFVDGQPASATVRANTAVELFEITHEALSRILDEDVGLRARVYGNLLQSLVERLRNTNIYIDYLQRKRTEH